MKINGTDFPNFNYGYNTEIVFDFEISRLGNNKISIWDAGIFYDKYRCSGTLILTETQMNSLFAIYNNLNRGESVTLTDCVETGFYPFTTAVNETSYTVWIDEPKNKGMTDDIGKLFKIELSFLWEFPNLGGVSTITWNNPLPYCKEGSLKLLDNTDIVYPESGFKIKKGHDVYNDNYKGPVFYGVNFPTESSEYQRSEFNLKLRGNAASNLIYRLVNTYRGQIFYIEGGDNYYIFGLDKGDNTQFEVKLNDGKLKIQHTAYESFNIKFDIVLSGNGA